MILGLNRSPAYGSSPLIATTEQQATTSEQQQQQPQGEASIAGQSGATPVLPTPAQELSVAIALRAEGHIGSMSGDEETEPHHPHSADRTASNVEETIEDAESHSSEEWYACRVDLLEFSKYGYRQYEYNSPTKNLFYNYCLHILFCSIWYLSFLYSVQV